ncbi:MAG: dihydrolipoyl dehydrogenase [Gammaproteobacteria bacterium RIFCSPHIGHO2_12_38_15]|nr:MAG: dihydrolipoyl dehydrogenase [Gammaproteobacteria bacterium RIFCSPHIGHO2_12_38_15]
MSTDIQTEVVVLGSGPGGYTAAFRAADLGKKVVLIERYNDIGGVCLNVGCIPSKALLHIAKVIDETNFMRQHGLETSEFKFDKTKIVAWKNNVIKRLTGGLKMLAKQRKVEVVTGYGKFISANEIQVETKEGSRIIHFENAIIAAGSQPVKLPIFPDDSRILDSTSALELNKIGGSLLVVGGGIIGLEMATVYHALGTSISIVELGEDLVPGCDRDIIAPFQKRIAKLYKEILLSTKVTKVEAKTDGLWASFEGINAAKEAQRYDQVLVAIGRKPNGNLIAAESAGIHVDERGFIPVDKQQRTNIPHIFAIGDIVGNPMLAHKASPEGRIAAEVISGKKHYFQPLCIPAVAYTDPEIAWTGITETQAKAKNIPYEKATFPWAASGRSLSLGRDEGLTKLIFDPSTHRVIGGCIVGPNAGELISEISLAIEMGCDAEDLTLTIHPHPTLSETIPFASEIFEGTITDLYLPKKAK